MTDAALFLFVALGWLLVPGFLVWWPRSPEAAELGSWLLRVRAPGQARPAVGTGVMRTVVEFGDDGPRVVRSGDLAIRAAHPALIGTRIVVYALDEERLRGLLESVRAGEAVDGALLALEAASLPIEDRGGP